MSAAPAGTSTAIKPLSTGQISAVSPLTAAEKPSSYGTLNSTRPGSARSVRAVKPLGVAVKSTAAVARRAAQSAV